MDFGSVTPNNINSLDRILERAKNANDEGANADRIGRAYYECGWSHLYEVVLTDDQLRSGWDKILKERGFKLGPRWFNSNSGNYCTMLFYNAHGPRGRNRTKTPYTW
jgi:hypothetical protein